VCCIIPVTDKLVGAIRNFYRKIRMPIYPFWIIGIAIIGVLFMAVPRLLFHEIIFDLDEVGELYLAVGFLLFALAEIRKVKSG